MKSRSRSPRQLRRAGRRTILALALAAAAIVVAGTVLLTLASAPSAVASGGQVSLFEDDDALLANPVSTLQELRHLGVAMVRLNVRWSLIAPDPNSRTRPKFKATDPNAYPPASWAPYDAVVRAARAEGIQLMLTPTGFAPLWAQGSDPSKFGAHYNDEFAFMPSPSEYGQFVQALGKRYPSVHTWELYNEPNFGEDLAPQAIDHSTVLYSPVMYRSLLSAGWNALKAAGHRRDTIIIGAIAAYGDQRPSRRGSGLPGTYGESPALEFVRELYCLDPGYHPYSGSAARIRNCPATAAASRRFVAQNPALFDSSGWSDHPHPLGLDGGSPPTTTHYHNADYAGFAQLATMIGTLDRIQRLYGLSKHFPLWNTEYGYVTDPPNKIAPHVSPDTAAYYENWAEYLSWRNRRIASAMHFLLSDPNPSVGTPECGGFSSGLLYFTSLPTTAGCAAYVPGQPKAGYDAYRLPIFLPNTTARAGHPLTVWGCIRPAHYALLDTRKPQTGQLQYQRGPGGAWLTVASITIKRSTDSCYFTRSVTVPASGSVRLAWSYPSGDADLEAILSSARGDPLFPAVSRSVRVTVT